MKKLIIIIFLFSISCLGQEKHCVSRYKYLTYSFKVNNMDSNCIGFYLVEGDESMGVKSIALHPNSKYVYIVDGYHDNIKRIDIITGQMMSNKKLNEFFNNGDFALLDIAVFSDKVYVTSNSDILIFDFDLNYLSSIKVDSEAPNTLRFSKVTKDSLLVYLSHKQTQDMTIEKVQLVITDKTNFTNKVRIPINQFIEDGKKQRTLGKEYRVNEINSKVCLYNQHGCYKLKVPLPNIKYYGSRNIDFDDKTIVYFDSTPTQFTLYCYLINVSSM